MSYHQNRGLKLGLGCVRCGCEVGGNFLWWRVFCFGIRFENGGGCILLGYYRWIGYVSGRMDC